MSRQVISSEPPVGRVPPTDTTPGSHSLTEWVPRAAVLTLSSRSRTPCAHRCHVWPEPALSEFPVSMRLTPRSTKGRSWRPGTTGVRGGRRPRPPRAGSCEFSPRGQEAAEPQGVPEAGVEADPAPAHSPGAPALQEPGTWEVNSLIKTVQNLNFAEWQSGGGAGRKPGNGKMLVMQH